MEKINLIYLRDRMNQNNSLFLFNFQTSWLGMQYTGGTHTAQ